MNRPMTISIGQQKLLASAIRVKLLQVLKDTPRTAKQAAELLGQTPGNVHYHMKRLLEGEFIELVETRNAGGITEKYYKSLSTVFHTEADPRPGVETQLYLTKEEEKQLKHELAELLEKWEVQTAFREHSGDQREFRVNVELLEVKTGF